MKQPTHDHVIRVEFEAPEKFLPCIIRIVHVDATDQYDALTKLAAKLKAEKRTEPIIKILF